MIFVISMGNQAGTSFIMNIFIKSDFAILVKKKFHSERFWKKILILFISDKNLSKGFWNYEVKVKFVRIIFYFSRAILGFYFLVQICIAIYNGGLNGLCLANIGNTSNLNTNHCGRQFPSLLFVILHILPIKNAPVLKKSINDKWENQIDEIPIWSFNILSQMPPDQHYQDVTEGNLKKV